MNDRAQARLRRLRRKVLDFGDAFDACLKLCTDNPEHGSMITEMRRIVISARRSIVQEGKGR